MSDLPAPKQETDLTPKDLENIKQFIADGKPGLAKVGESDFHRMSEMYMKGFTYRQISMILRLPKTLITYVSHTYGWYPARQEYLSELQEKIKGRVIESNVESQDFLLLLIKAYHKKLGNQLSQYLSTDDVSHANQINLKEIDKLLKAVMVLKELNGNSKNAGKQPAVGLDLEGFSGTIERSEDNKLTITPTIDKHLDEMLQKFADSRREEQNRSDINKNKPKKEESPDEN